MSFANLRLLIFLPAILIPACASSNLAFHMMYSAYKLNKQGDNIQPDVLLSQFGTSPLFYVWVLTSVRPENRFRGRKVKWSGIAISLRISPQFGVIHTKFVGISYRKANLSFFAKMFIS